jgi:streptogramin lyase
VSPDVERTQLRLVARIIGVALLVLPVATRPREQFERGDALYRYGAFGFGHAGLYIDWLIDRCPDERTSHTIIDAITEGRDSVVIRDFEDFCSGGTFWSVRRWRHAASADMRRTITDKAIEIATHGAHYNFFGGYKNPLGEHPSFRCDGLVEYCYESALGHPWWPGLNGGIVFNDTWFTMSPLTQMLQLRSERDARLDTVMIVSPCTDDTVSGILSVLAYLHDGIYGSGVAKAQLWIDDDTLKKLEELAPGDTWGSAHFEWNSRKVTNGQHLLFVRGFDQAGNDTTDSIIVFIENEVPTVTRTYPEDRQRDIPPDTHLWVEFNKRMDTTSVEIATLFHPQAVVHSSWDDSCRLLLLEPELDLDYCSEYALTISDSARDHQGRRLDGDGDGEPGGEFRLTFQTGPPRLRIWAEPPVSHVNQGETRLHRISVQNLSREVVSGFLCAEACEFGWEVEPLPLSSPFTLEPDSVHSQSILVKNLHALAPLEIEFGAELDECAKKSEIYSWVAGDHIWDHPDETYDVSDRSYSSPWSIDSQAPVGLLLSGWGDGLGHLLGQFNISTAVVKPSLAILGEFGRDISDLKVLLVGSAGLSGLGGSTAFRKKIDRFVYKGGALVVLSQQNGEDFECLPGYGLEAKGWNQDQSCFWKAAYIDEWHPVLSAQTSGLLNCSVDGYFPSWPIDSKLILRRSLTTMPCLLIYEHGEGAVLVTSLFSDWGLGHSQATQEERFLLRDIVTWALDPDSHIPCYEPDQSIDIEAVISNPTAAFASSCLISLLAPDRDTAATYSVVLSPPLGPGCSRTLNVECPGQSQLGIYPVYAMLVESAGNPVGENRLLSRFAVRKQLDSKRWRPDGPKVWATTQTEFVLKDSDVEYEIYLSNRTSDTLPGTILIGVHEDGGRWWDIVDSLTDIRVPPQSTATFLHSDSLCLSTSTYFGFYDEMPSSPSDFFKDALCRCEKGVWVGPPRCRLVLDAATDTVCEGETLEVAVQVVNLLPVGFNALADLSILGPQHQRISTDLIPLIVDPIFGALDSARLAIPSSLPAGRYSVEGLCIYDTIAIAKSRTHFMVPHPHLVARVDLPDAVGSADPMRISLVNDSPKSDSGGVVCSWLLAPDGDTAWVDSVSFGTILPYDSTTIELFPNVDEVAFGKYTLHICVLGEAPPVVTTFEFDSRVVSRLSLYPTTPIAGKELSIRLELGNSGRFMTEAELLLEVPGIYTGSEKVCLNPNQEQTVNFTMVLPDSISPGCYPIYAAVCVKDRAETESYLFLSSPSLSLEMNQNIISTADTLLVTVRNHGNTSSNARIELGLVDQNGFEIFSLDTLACILPSDSCTMHIPVPPNAASGDYILDITAADALRGLSELWQRSLHIDGTSCGLVARTSDPAYSSEQPIALHFEAANASTAFLAQLQSSINDERPTTRRFTRIASDSTNALDGCKIDGGHILISPHATALDTAFVFANGSSMPSYVAVDSKGHIYATDFLHNRVCKLDQNGRMTCSWGKGGCGEGEFNGIWGVAVDDTGIVYVSDFLNSRIQKFSPNGSYIGGWDVGGAPWDICVDDSRFVYVVDWSNSKIRKFSFTGDPVAEWGAPGSGIAEFNSPWGIGTDGNLIYVADTYNHRIQVFTGNGDFVRDWGGNESGEGGLTYPSDVAVDDLGFVYAGELGPYVSKFTQQGEFVARFMPEGEYPPAWSIAAVDDKTLLTSGYDYRIDTYLVGTRATVTTPPLQIEGAEKIIAFLPTYNLNDGSVSFYGDLGSGWQPMKKLVSRRLPGSTLSLRAVFQRESSLFESPDLTDMSLVYLVSPMDPAHWQDTTTVELEPDTTISIDTAALIGPASGALYLNSSLSNDLTQTLASTSYPFFVATGRLLLSFYTDRGVYLPDEDVLMSAMVENSSNDYLDSVVVQISSGDQVFVVDTLVLGPFQQETLLAMTSAESSFTTSALAMSAEGDSAFISRDIRVEPRSLAIHIDAPTRVSHRAFAPNLEIANTSAHPLDLKIETFLSDSLLTSVTKTLDAYGVHRYHPALSLTQNESIGLSISGDLDTCLSREVIFFETASLEPEIEELYDTENQEIPLDVLNPNRYELEYCILATVNDTTGFNISSDTIRGVLPGRGSRKECLVYSLDQGIYSLDYRLLCSCGNQLDSGRATLKVGRCYEATIDSITVCLDRSLPCDLIMIEPHLLNTGTKPFRGTLSIELPFAEDHSEVSLRSGEAQSCTFFIQSQPPADTYTLASTLARLGEIIDTSSYVLDLEEEYALSVAETLLCKVGEFVSCPFCVTNSGKASGQDEVCLDLPSIFGDCHHCCLDPCSTMSDSFILSIPPDLESGMYAAVLSIQNIEKDLIFAVSGLQLGVLAELDKQKYAVADTAILSLRTQNLCDTLLALDLRLNSGEFEAQDSLTLSPSDTATVVVSVPVVDAGSSIFYGFYLEGGRAIYLDAIRLVTTRDTAYVYTERSTYNSGDTATALVISKVSGTLSYAIFDEPFPGDTLHVVPPGSTFTFPIPDEIATGTYSIDYTLTADQEPELSLCGSHKFDVVGYSLRILRSTTDRTSYRTDDTLRATQIVKFNRECNVLSQGWIRDAQGRYTDCYKEILALPQGQTRVEISGPIHVTNQGQGSFIYAFFRPEPDDEYALLLATGSSAIELAPLDTVPPEFIWFSANPDTFNPLRGERTEISFALSETCGLCEIVIEDAFREPVSSWLFPRLGPESHRVAWAAENLPAGEYAAVSWARDKSHNISDTMRTCIFVAADTIPPVTTIHIGQPSFAQSPAYIASSTSLALEAGDDITGIARTQYSINTEEHEHDTTWQQYEVPFAIDLPDGPFHLAYRSADRAGNVESTRSAYLYMDNTPPSIHFDISEPKYSAEIVYVTPRTGIGIETEDDASGCAAAYYILDSDNPIAFDDSIVLAVAVEGLHRLSITAYDQLGNTSEDTLAVAVDDTPPKCELTAGLPRFVTSSGILVTSQTRIDIEASDPLIKEVACGVCDIQYIIQNQAPVIMPDSVASFFLFGQDNAHLVVYSARDQLGNISHEDTTRFILDNTPPITKIELPYDSTLVNRTISIIGTADDLHFGSYIMEYGAGLDPVEWRKAGQPVGESVEDSLLWEFDTRQTGSKGPFLLRLQAEDLVGNAAGDSVMLNASDLIVQDTLFVADPRGLEVSEGTVYISARTGIFYTDPQFRELKSLYHLEKLTDVASGRDGSLTLPQHTRLLRADPPKGPVPFIDALQMARSVERDMDLNIYVTEVVQPLSRGRVSRYDEKGRLTLEICDLAGAFDLSVDAGGCIYVTDTGRHLVRKYDHSGEALMRFGGFGSAPGRMNQPSGVTVEPNGYIWVSDTGNRRIQSFDPRGNRLYDFYPPAHNARDRAQPVDLDLDENLSVYVVDTLSQWVLRLVRPPLEQDGELASVSHHPTDLRLMVRNLSSTPNPFNPDRGVAVVRFSLSREALARLLIYDMGGRNVASLEMNCQEGWNEATWDGCDSYGRPIFNGVYYLRLIASSGGEIATVYQKIAIIR